ncbi:MAG: hypothetical protein RL728_751 [Bacteroidota bacterium]|jgi:hypothetical protein
MGFSPGSKGWINKYADYINRGKIIVDVEKPKELSLEHFAHLQLSQSGIVFGFPTELIFLNQLKLKEEANWTTEEKLKLLLFESQLFIFVLNGGDVLNEFDSFIDSLNEYYGKYSFPAIHKLTSFFLKETQEERLEYILDKRIDIKQNFIDNALWVNYLNNAFVYLDVILYHEFIKTKKSIVDSNFEELALDVLKTIVISAFSDGEMQQPERVMFDVFLASANLSDSRKKIALHYFKNGATFTDLSALFSHIWLFKRFLIDISVLTMYSNHDTISQEKEFLYRFCDFLHIPREELNETIVSIEQFVVSHADKISFLKNRSAVEHIYDNISMRWIKILGRNKDKLIAEIKQSKELMQLIKKSTTEDLTKEEKEKVKTQFMDIVKTMPAITIFMLPGGAILMPIVLKIIPALIPSAFRDNEIEV